MLDIQADLWRRPDVEFVSAERWPLDREIPEEDDWAAVPTLAVEVTSPHDLFHEVHGKVREYFAHGVNDGWVVIPEERQVFAYHSPTEVHIRDVISAITGGEILPEFELPLANLVRREVVSKPVEAPRLLEWVKLNRRFLCGLRDVIGNGLM